MAIDINGTVLLNMRIFITIDAIYKNGSTVLCQCSDSNITAGVVNKGAVVTAQINPDTPPESEISVVGSVTDCCPSRPI